MLQPGSASDLFPCSQYLFALRLEDSLQDYEGTRRAGMEALSSELSELHLRWNPRFHWLDNSKITSRYNACCTLTLEHSIFLSHTSTVNSTVSWEQFLYRLSLSGRGRRLQRPNDLEILPRLKSNRRAEDWNVFVSTTRISARR